MTGAPVGKEADYFSLVWKILAPIFSICKQITDVGDMRMTVWPAHSKKSHNICEPFMHFVTVTCNSDSIRSFRAFHTRASGC